MKIVLVRHGQTTSNTTRALDTDLPGAPLDEVGLQQAEELAADFIELVGSVPDAIFVSPLLRTRQTAAPLESQFQITGVIDAGIREVRAGNMEMSTSDEHVYKYLDTILAWVAGDLEVRMPGGESGHEVFTRFSVTIGEALNLAVKHGWETVVFVCHGAICRFIAASLSSEITAPLVATFPMHNATTTVLELEVEGIQIPFADPAQWFTYDWNAISWSNKPIAEYSDEVMADKPVPSGLRNA